MVRVTLLTAIVAAMSVSLAPAAHAGTLDSLAAGCDDMDPAVCLLPWPNDLFTRPDPATATGKRLNLNPLSTPRNLAGKRVDVTELNRNDGFSPGSAILTRVSGLDTQAAFDRSGLVPEIDMKRAFDEDQPVVVIDTQTLERHPVWAELDTNTQNPAERVLIVRPARNFLEGHRYIVALRRLRRADGSQIQPSEPFRRYRDRIPTTDPAFEARRAHMEQIFETLKRAQVNRRHLYLAWDFTVASERDRSERILHMRDTAFAELGDTDLADLVPQGGAPAFEIESVTNFRRDQDPRVARRVTGTFTVPCFLDKPGCGPGSRMLYAPGSNVPTRIPGNTHEATFTCNLPHEGLSEGGSQARPSLYGHGLLGGQSEVNSGAQKDMVSEHNMIYCATDWYGFATEDLGSVALTLLDTSNFPLLVDRMQQGFLAHMFLGRLLVHPQGFSSDAAFQRADGTAAIDTTRLYYDGNSQGGIMGGALMAVIPDAQRGVLGVPGMNYSTLLQRSVDFEADPENPCPPSMEQLIENLPDADPSDPESFLEVLGFSYSCPLYASYPNVLERQLLLGLMQQLWDRGEANGYAQHMTSDPLPNTPPHEVLLHVALGDHQVAQVAAEVEARTIGAHVRPVAVDPGRSYDVEPQWGIPKIAAWPFAGSAYELWDSGPIRIENGSVRGTDPPPVGTVPPRAGRDPHSEPRATRIARQQKSAFMQPDGKVIDVCNAGPCYSRGWKGSQ